MVARQRVTLIQRLMRQRRLTREQTLEVLSRRAQSLGVRDFTLSLRQLDRWLAGEVGTEPRPSTCRVVEVEFGHPIEQLLAGDGELPPDPDTDPGQNVQAPSLVDDSARASAKLTVWADSIGIGDLSLTVLRARLTSLSHAYVHSPLTPVFKELVDLRDDLFTMIKGRPDPARLPEAYFLAGTTCSMLAYASGDLGFPDAAMIQAQAALACAEKASHPTLKAWVLGNQAMTSEWYGRPREGLRLAAQAAAHAREARVPGTVLVRLASIEARAHSRMGNGPAAREAMDRAQAARDLVEGGYSDGRDEFDEMGGILTFTLAKQHFYGGSTYLRIGDPPAAHRAALASIDAYTSGPPYQRSYGDEALAWVDVAIARADLPGHDLDGAAAALTVVHSLPPSKRIPALVQPVCELRSELSMPHHKRATVASQMLGMIDDLLSDCRAPAPEISA